MLQQHPHFLGNAGEHDGEAGGAVEPEAGRGAPAIAEHQGPAGHLRLGAVARHRGSAEPGEPRQQVGPYALVEVEGRAVESGHRDLGDVVAGRAQPAGREHRPGAPECVGHALPDLVGAVAHGRPAHDPNARRREPSSDLRAVGVEGEAEQQLGPDGDQLEIHAASAREGRGHLWENRPRLR